MTSSRSSGLAYVSLFAALVAVFGLIPKIDLPLGVPITLQTLGVMLAGCMLGPKKALQALLLFLAAVALGLPLLSGGRGGLGLAGSTGLCVCAVRYTQRNRRIVGRTRQCRAAAAAGCGSARPAAGHRR